MSGRPSPAFDEPIASSFFRRDVDRVARSLLGCVLVRDSGRTNVGGMIVETEAYGGPGDIASHAHRAPEGRARIMFGPPGVAYVYVSYGIHHCMNVVTGPEGVGQAVLIRAVHPLWGTEAMRRRTPTALPDHKLASGPGRVCRALGIDKRDHGADLTCGSLRIARGRASGPVCKGTRVGLSKDDGRPWRYWLDDAAVSSPRPDRRR